MVYFWPIFVTQIFWVFINNWRRNSVVPGILRTQFLVFMLGSPLLAIVAFQSKRTSYIEESFLFELFHFFQFGFLFEPELYLEHVQNYVPAIIIIEIFVLAAFLFIIGLMQRRNRNEVKELGITGPNSVFMVIICIICFIAILVFAAVTHTKYPNRTGVIIATSCIPVLFLFFDFFFQKYWDRSGTFRARSNYESVVNNCTSLNTLLGTVPALATACISIITPIFVARGVLLFIPYFIIVICRGVASLIRKHSLWGMIIIILAVIHFFGIKHWDKRVHSPRNYKELYEKLEPKIQESDLIFVYRHWAMTQIFYYLKEDRCCFVGQDYSQAIEENPNAKIWVLCLPGIPMKQEIKDSLRDYELKERVDAFNIWSLLYQRNP